MAYLSGLKVGKTPSPGLGALTGFAAGAARGIQDAEQIKAQRMRLALAQQEMTLRQQAFAHGLQQEQQVRDWSQKLGEYQAWRAGTADELQTQGPVQPGQPPLPTQGTDWKAVSDKLGELASSIPDAKTRDAFLTVAHQEEQNKLIEQHKGRILSGLNDRIAKNAYSRRVYGGAEDPSGAEAAQALMEQVQNLDMSDPESAAKLLDYVEQQDKALRVATVQHNVQMQARENLVAQTEQQIMGREGAGAPVGEAKALLEAYKGDLIDDATFQKMLPDAMNGTLQMKLQKIQSDIEAAQMRQQLIEAQAELARVKAERERTAPTQFDLIRERGAQQRMTNEAKSKLVLPGNNGTATKPLDRAKLIADDLKSMRANALDTRSDEEKLKAATANADAMLKGADSKEQLIRDLRAGGLKGSEAKARADALGLSYDEVKAALAGK